MARSTVRLSLVRRRLIPIRGDTFFHENISPSPGTVAPVSPKDWLQWQSPSVPLYAAGSTTGAAGLMATILSNRTPGVIVSRPIVSSSSAHPPCDLDSAVYTRGD